MKHPSSREFYSYWNDKRGAARAPDRSEIEPGAVRGLLGDIFVLSYDATDGYPFRVAGTRVCALLGCDLKDRGFSTLFAAESRREIEDIITVVAEETLAAVAGITATAQAGSPAGLWRARRRPGPAGSVEAPGPWSGPCEGWASSTGWVIGRPRAAARMASTAPEEYPKTEALPPAATMSASRSSISRSTAYGKVSLLVPRPRRS